MHHIVFCSLFSLLMPQKHELRCYNPQLPLTSVCKHPSLTGSRAKGDCERLEAMREGYLDGKLVVLLRILLQMEQDRMRIHYSTLSELQIYRLRRKRIFHI